MNQKIILTLSLIPILILANISFVSAKNIVLAVANAQSLDPVFEQPLYNILASMNNTVTPIDQHSAVNYANYDLLVVAGRPPSAQPLPSSFAASLPVNSMPTIAIDYWNLYNWGWVDSGGVNIMTSGSVQSIYIAQNLHPITFGYAPNQRVFIHNQTGLEAVDLVSGTTNFNPVAFLDTWGDYAIAFAAPNTNLINGQRIAGNSVSVYFGTTYPAYWTSDTVNLFENAVNWVLNINYTPPTVPALSGPSWAISNSATYSWTSSTGANGVQSYEIQVSTTSSFSQIFVDKPVSSLSYTLTTMQDGQRYYVRVRSIDYLNLQSQWSNTISTIADFTPIILTITSPASGSYLQIGQSVFATVLIDAARVQQGSVCNFSIDNDFIGSLSFNMTTGSCYGMLTIPPLSPGPTNANFIASIQDEFGAVNSTSIPVTTDRFATAITTTSTTTAPVETSSSGSSSGGSYYYSILSVTAPTNETLYTNYQNSFTITVRNDGNQAAHAVKIWVTSSNLSVSISPASTYDFDAGAQKTYVVNVPTAAAGNYNLVIRTLSYETTETAKIIPILVTEKPIIVGIGITSIEIPDFTQGTTALTNITLLNKGDVAGTANVNLALPDGWTASSSTASMSLQPNAQTTLSFEVTPSSSSGDLTFSGTFSGNGETKSFSYPTAVTSKSNLNPLAGITGALATVFGNPMIVIPVILAAAVIFTMYYKFRTDESFSKYVWPKGVKSFTSVAPKSHQRNNFKIKNTNPSVASSPSKNNAYEKWERSR